MSKFHTANVSVGLGRYHTSAVYHWYQLLTGAPDTNTKPAVTMYCIADNTHGRQCSICQKKQWGVLGASKIFCVGAQIEAPKGPMGRVWGGGIPLPSRLKGLGERRELPSGVRAAQTLFKHILGSQNGSGTGKMCDILPNVKQNFVIFLAWYRHFLTA